MKRPGRARVDGKKKIEGGFRVTARELDIIDRAGVLDAKAKSLSISRNNFMLRTLMPVATKILTEAGEKIPKEK